MHGFLAVAVHLLGGDLKTAINDNVAKPLLDAAKLLIPAFVCISGLHKLMEHRESGGAFLLEMLVKGGGAVVLITVVQQLL
jgi:hypothetical protein